MQSELDLCCIWFVFVRDFCPNCLQTSNYFRFFFALIFLSELAQWLRCCATNRKVACSIPAGVSGIFIDTRSFRLHYGPEVDSASNRNEYQEYFLGVKAAGA